MLHLLLVVALPSTLAFVQHFDRLHQVALEGGEGGADGRGAEAVGEQAEVGEASLDAGLQAGGGSTAAEGGAVLGHQVHKLLTDLPEKGKRQNISLLSSQKPEWGAKKTTQMLLFSNPSILHRERAEAEGCLVQYVCLTHWSFIWRRFRNVWINGPDRGSEISAASLCCVLMNPRSCLWCWCDRRICQLYLGSIIFYKYIQYIPKSVL